MIGFVKRMWAAAPIATVLLALSVVAFLFFSVRMTAFWIYWNDPAHHEQQIEDWMTPGYIAHSWKVPLEVVTDALGLPPSKARPGPISLRKIAEDQGKSVEELQSEVMAAIVAFQAGARPPAGGMP